MRSQDSRIAIDWIAYALTVIALMPLGWHLTKILLSFIADLS